jgi:CRISPR-associated exonuclease Cas4
MYQNNIMEYNEEDFLLLSGIQHFIFCRRQWALIHIEQQWQENLRTVEGQILHDRAHDNTIKEKRGNLIISRGTRVFSRTLGLTGTCDVIEYHQSPDGIKIFGHGGNYKPIPVEYKRGRPKENRADEIQLCAQVMCLEEMLICHITEAFLYYGDVKHRLKVVIDNELRQRVRTAAREMHELYERRHTPKTKISKACRACSLADICMPKLCKNLSVTDYIRKNIEEVAE